MWLRKARQNSHDDDGDDDCDDDDDDGDDGDGTFSSLSNRFFGDLLWTC